MDLLHTQVGGYYLLEVFQPRQTNAVAKHNGEVRCDPTPLEGRVWQVRKDQLYTIIATGKRSV